MRKLAIMAVFASPLSAFAAVPANVSTSMADGLTDASAVAALGLIIVVGVAVFKYMRRGV